MQVLKNYNVLLCTSITLIKFPNENEGAADNNIHTTVY